MKKFWISISIVLIVALIGGIVYLRATPAGRTTWNRWLYGLDKADEQTYENQKEVEDTCRAMIASYTADKLKWEQWKNSADSEEKSWASQAKMRANQTASTYNNYILKNNYVWKSNVPADIYMTLPYLD